VSLADTQAPARFQPRQAVDFDQLDQGSDEGRSGLGLERGQVGGHAPVGCHG
jgi:hypothetical protein